MARSKNFGRTNCLSEENTACGVFPLGTGRIHAETPKTLSHVSAYKRMTTLSRIPRLFLHSSAPFRDMWRHI
jgi:hypothetical protein